MKKGHYSVSRVSWRGIALEIRHCPNWCGTMGLDHIEVESAGRVLLPITATGYKSQFLSPDRLTSFGLAADYILAWMERESQSEAWKHAEDKARQLSLF